MKSLIALGVIILSLPVLAKDIYFEIPMGTAEQLLDWNSSENPVRAEVGDTLIIINRDTAPHRLHTDRSRPCAHGELMTPMGGTWSCVLTEEYSSFEEETPARDHFNYDLKFWIIVRPAQVEKN